MYSSSFCLKSSTEANVSPKNISVFNLPKKFSITLFGNLVILLEKDLRQSFKYLKKAAEHGSGVAQHTLGMAYLTGKLLDTENYCEINGELALSWLKKSAEQAHDFQDDAMLELGKIYDSGEIVPKNEAEAKKWYEKAAAAGSFGAKKKLASQKTEENKSQAKISEDELLALNKALSKTINDDQDDDLDFEKAFEEAMAADDDDEDAGVKQIDVLLGECSPNKKDITKDESFSDKRKQQEVIAGAVADFFSNLPPLVDSVYLSPAIPNRKEQNLRNKANIPMQESLYALIDCTVFGSAKNGVAFTCRGIWGHNDWNSSNSGPFFCSWEKFIEYDKELVIINYEIRFASGFFLETSGCSNRELVLDMLKNLKQHIKQTITNTSYDIPSKQAEQGHEKAKQAEAAEKEKMAKLAEEDAQTIAAAQAEKSVDLIADMIIDDNCIGCTKCKRYCPVDAITGEIKQKHFIDINKCTKCGICLHHCPKNAITQALSENNNDFSDNAVDLILDNCGTNIDEVRKKICEIFQIEYANAKEYTDIAPVYLCQEISLADAEYVKQNLEAVGAVLRIEPSKQNDITDNSTTEPDALIGIAKVMITNFGSNKVEVIKLIRSYANLSLISAKQIVDQNQKYFIDFDSWKKAYDAWNELQSAGATVALAGELLSDLSGTIIEFFAEPEKQFNKGDAIAIIESTDGEKSLVIPYDCKIIKIGVKQGQQVSAGEGLVIFEYNQQ